MSIKSRSFEAREFRKCRAKVKYHSWEAAERISRLNTTSDGVAIFKTYQCNCGYIHLATRDKLRISKRMIKRLEKAS